MIDELYWSLPVKVRAKALGRMDNRHFARFVALTGSGLALVAFWEHRHAAPYPLLVPPNQLAHAEKGQCYPAMPDWAMPYRPDEYPWLTGDKEKDLEWLTRKVNYEYP